LSKVLSPETTFDERVAERTAAIGIVGLGYAGLPLAMAFAETEPDDPDRGGALGDALVEGRFR